MRYASTQKGCMELQSELDQAAAGRDARPGAVPDIGDIGRCGKRSHGGGAGRCHSADLQETLILEAARKLGMQRRARPADAALNDF